MRDPADDHQLQSRSCRGEGATTVYSSPSCRERTSLCKHRKPGRSPSSPHPPSLSQVGKFESVHKSYNNKAFNANMYTHLINKGVIRLLPLSVFACFVALGIPFGCWSLSCGGAHSAAISEDGLLYMWGYNRYAQCGQNNCKDVDSSG